MAVFLFAQLAAVLPRDADGVFALFGDAGIVDDPGGQRLLFLDQRQGPASQLSQQGLVAPGRVGDQMVQRLVDAADVVGHQKGRHGLDAFAFERQQQAIAIALQRLNAAGMSGARARLSK